MVVGVRQVSVELKEGDTDGLSDGVAVGVAEEVCVSDLTGDVSWIRVMTMNQAGIWLRIDFWCKRPFFMALRCRQVEF